MSLRFDGLAPAFQAVHHGKQTISSATTASAVVTGVVNSSSVDHSIAAGPAHTFASALLGHGHSDFLVAASAAPNGEAPNGSAVHAPAVSPGSEWALAGAGDLDAGHDPFLIEHAAGGVVIGEWLNGAVHSTAVPGLGPEWALH